MAVRCGGIGLVRELIELQRPLQQAPLAERRAQYERAERTFGKHLTQGERIDASGCPAEWVLPRRQGTQPIVVYVHGGGYSLGSSASHRHLSAEIGRVAEAAVLSLDYRCAPECQFPAAVDDVVAATNWLLERVDAPVFLAGDSAGGGLVVSAMVALREAGRRMPTAGICMSPWVDLSCNSQAYTRLADRDPLLSAAELRRLAAAYLGDCDSGHPLASPLYAKLGGLPPLLIQVGSEELLLDDARALAGKARSEGVQVTLREWEGMIHAWQWYFPVLGEAQDAIAEIEAFICAKSSRPRWAPSHMGSDARRTVPASLIQEAHLLIAPWTAGRGFLSWIYQLNGPLDAHALSRAIDDVVRRHEILRVRFEPCNGGVQQVVTPFRAGVLEHVDLSGYAKQRALEMAVEQAGRQCASLSPVDDAPLRVTLYSVARKTSVLAMFVAEALVDTDSGSLLCSEISRAYAKHAGLPAPVALPQTSGISYLDHPASDAPDPETTARDQKHWVAQALSMPPNPPSWIAPSCRCGHDEPARDGGSTCSFHLTPPEWTSVVSAAQMIATTPFVVVLTCLQIAVAETTGVDRMLVHTVVSRRDRTARGIIGNFHSLTRIVMRLDNEAPFDSAVRGTASAVAEAIEHSALPAPMAGSQLRRSGCSESPLPSVRFYMFANRHGPVFAGVRRRRFRLHGAADASLSVSCIHGPKEGQDFVLSSATGSQEQLELLAMLLYEAIKAAAGVEGLRARSVARSQVSDPPQMP
jgi:phosphinothricin tripeptide acetyl hydrolase